MENWYDKATIHCEVTGIYVSITLVNFSSFNVTIGNAFHVAWFATFKSLRSWKIETRYTEKKLKGNERWTGAWAKE